MAKWIKALCIAVCSFSLLFACIGYAAISGELSITGDVEGYVAPVYISSAKPLAAYSSTAVVNATSETVLNSTVSLSSSKNVAILEVVVKNRSNVSYGYLATEADPQLYQNSAVSYALYTDAACTQKLERRTELPAHDGNAPGEITVYLKISGKSVTSTAAQFQTALNLVFKTPIDSIPAPDSADDEVAVDNALARFEKILNTEATFATLVNQMTGSGKVNANDRYDDSYIAYVPATIGKTNSSGQDFTDDNVALDLFGGELNLIIDGVEYQVYFLLKRENVDGDTSTGDANGEEYTLYMTTNPLTDSSSWASQKKASVYAGVFTSNNDGGIWYQLGDMLTGEAPICDYDGGGLGSAFGRPTGSGSFHTDTWKTTEAYYGVAKGKKVVDVMSANVSDLSALNTSIAEAEKIIANAYYDTVYTEASRARLETALETAKAMQGNSRNHTQAQVVTCARILKNAIVSLEDTV